MAMTLRLTDQDAEELRARAERDGTSMQDVALTAVRTYLHDKDRQSVFEAALADTLVRYRTTIKRLGE